MKWKIDDDRIVIEHDAASEEASKLKLMRGRLTLKQAAARLGLSEERTGVLIRSGRLPGVKVGRSWIVWESDVDKIERRKAGRPEGSPDRKPRKRRGKKVA